MIAHAIHWYRYSTAVLITARCDITVLITNRKCFHIYMGEVWRGELVDETPIVRGKARVCYWLMIRPFGYVACACALYYY